MNVKKDFSLMVKLVERDKAFTKKPSGQTLHLWLLEIFDNCNAYNWNDALSTVLVRMQEPEQDGFWKGN